MKVPNKNIRLIVHELDDEILLYDPEIDRSHRLNVSAAFIWQQCDGARSVDEIANLLTERFEVNYEVAHRDTRQAVDRLVGERVLTYAHS